MSRLELPPDPAASSEREDEPPLGLSEQSVVRRIAARDPRPDGLAALGAISASVAHDIRSPLAVLIANQEVLWERLEYFTGQGKSALGPQLELSEILEDNGMAIGMIRRMVESLSAVAMEPLVSTPIEVGEVVRLAVRMLRRNFAEAGVRLEVTVPKRLEALASEPEFSRILINLLMNAAQAGPSGSTVRLRARRSAHGVIVAIEDEGEGVSPRDRERIFAAFHTTKSEGTGLGLSTARAMARRHGGDVVLAPSLGRGARFELRLRAP